VTIALRERLERIHGSASPDALVDELTAIAARCAELPVLDDRPSDVIRGYDEHGLPGGG
jgi:hypothetical protein